MIIPTTLPKTATAVYVYNIVFVHGVSIQKHNTTSIADYLDLVYVHETHQRMVLCRIRRVI
jgi:hypothetical protein